MRRILISFVLVIITISLISGCEKKQGEKERQGDMTNNKAEITVYIPKDQNFDRQYFNQKDVAINYLPDKKGDYTDKDVGQIVNNIDKHVKVVVINTNKKGLEPVFKKIKSKLPGVITVAGDIGEMYGNSSNKLFKNSYIDVAFKIEKDNNGYISAMLANQMKAKNFIYLYFSDGGTNPDVYRDIQITKQFCEENGIKFSKKGINSTDNLDKIKSEIKKISDENGRDTAIFPSDMRLSKPVLTSAIEYKFIVPNLNSDNDGELISKELGLEKEYSELARKDFDNKVREKLKSMNLNNKIALISEGRNSVAPELVIEIARYMYENNFMIEECYRDVSLIARGNRNIDLSITPKIMGQSSGYIRNLVLSPRIY